MSLYKMRISAKGMFFDKEGKILLIKGKTLYEDKPFWCAPGGGVEEGESLLAAAERELTEETGYFGKAEKAVFIQDYPHSNGQRNLEIFFLGRINESKKPLLDHDHEEFGFFDEYEFKKVAYLPLGVNPFELRRKNGAGYQTYL